MLFHWGTVAQLAVDIIAPALDSSASGHGTGMIASSADIRHPAGQRAHIHRDVAVGWRAVIAQLAIYVEAPAFDPPAGGQGAGVIQASRNLLDTAGQPADGYWQRPEGVRGIPQLAVIIVAPALDPASGCQGAGMVPACRQPADPAGQAADRGSRPMVHLAAIPQLALPVVAPAAHPTAGQGAAVPAPGADQAGGAGQAEHAHRRKLHFGPAVAQLPRRVIAPAYNHPAGRQGAGAVRARPQGQDATRQPADRYRDRSVGREKPASLQGVPRAKGSKKNNFPHLNTFANYNERTGDAQPHECGPKQQLCGSRLMTRIATNQLHPRTP